MPTEHPFFKEKKMKRFMTVSVIFAMLLSLTACEKTDKKHNAETTTVATEEVTIPEETTAVTTEEVTTPEETTTTAEETTVATAETNVAETTADKSTTSQMTMEDLVSLNEEFQKYLTEQQTAILVEMEFLSGVVAVSVPDDEYTLTYLYILNYPCFSETERQKIISNGLISNDEKDMKAKFTETLSYIGFYNGEYSRWCSQSDKNVVKENYMSLSKFVYDKSYEKKIADMDRVIYEYSRQDNKSLSKQLIEKETLSGYEYKSGDVTDLTIKETYDYSVLMQIFKDLESSEDELFFILLINNDSATDIIFE